MTNFLKETRDTIIVGVGLFLFLFAVSATLTMPVIIMSIATAYLDGNL